MHRFACVLLVDPAGRLLLQERDEHPAIDPEKWGMPGGHVEDGEDVEAAAYRELAEETGVVLPPGTLARVQDLEVFHDAYGTLDEVTVFAARCTLTDDDVVCAEGRQIVFVDAATARGLDLSGSASLAVPAFLDSDHYARLTRS